MTAARAAGLSISPREVFQLRTAEAMARAQSGRTTEIVDHADQPIGHVATTPIAARFSECRTQYEPSTSER